MHSSRNITNLKLTGLEADIVADNMQIPDYVWQTLPSELNAYKRRLAVLANDFYRESDFHAFYSEQAERYAERARLFKAGVPAGAMRTWLEAHFPARYEVYLIGLSPLTGGSHFTDRFVVDGDRTIVRVAPGPERAVLHPMDEALFARLLFTEIDHNYVNPVSEQHMDRINEVFGDFRRWNGQGRYYQSAIDTFNEYMTWAVFSIWAKERYDAETFDSITVEEPF